MSAEMSRHRVAAAAHEGGMGREISSKEAPGRPIRMAFVLLLSGLAALPFSVFLFWIIAKLGLKFLIIIPLGVLAYGLTAPIMGVKKLINRPQSWYIFEGGLIRLKGVKLQILPWGEISAIARKRVGRDVGILDLSAENLKGYRIITHAGSKFHVVAYDNYEEQARFCAALEQAAQLSRVMVTG